MSALRRLWEGWPGVALILAGLAFAVAADVARQTCGRDQDQTTIQSSKDLIVTPPLGVRGTLDGAGRFVPAGGEP